MTDRDDIERLRRSFQALAEGTTSRCSDEDTAAVWSAVRGELAPEARHALVNRLADEPALAEAWRIAHALQSPAVPVAPAAPVPRRMWSKSWLAAALVVLGVSTTLFMPRWRQEAPVLRQPAAYAVESLLGPQATLPRDAFELRWTAAPTGSRYRVTVTTEDLRVVVAASDLAAPALRVPVEALNDVAAGATIFWQVDVTLPANVRLSSRTFVVRVQ